MITPFAVVGLGAFLHSVYRPWQMTWGATKEEVDRAMVGDEVVAGATFVATRAITIRAGSEAIWPWLVQIGYHRAGFYSYDWLDNDRIPSARAILPEYQNLKVGDSIPLTAHEDAIVSALKPSEYMLLVFEPDSSATWAWGLYATEGGATRLVTRLRVQTHSVRSRLMLEYFELIMMRKHMLGIRDRAESLAAARGTTDHAPRSRRL